MAWLLNRGTFGFELRAVGHNPNAASTAGIKVGTVMAPATREASGIVASRKNPGVLWVHNDSGDTARLFALSYTGKLPQQDAIRYPDAALYHPDAPEPFADLASYQRWRAGVGGWGFGWLSPPPQTPSLCRDQPRTW